MKQLILARHAKSSWDDLYCADFDRGLNKRGKADLQVMGELLAEKIKKPDLIVSSPSKRTTKTVSAYAKAWGYKKKYIQREKSIYESSVETLCTIIESTPEDVSRLVLVGHNPGLTELVNLCGYTLENLLTCGVVVFEYTGELRGNFEQKKCSYVASYFPKIREE